MDIASPRTRVGKYEIGKLLGEGTFAKVKLAKNKETGESVAIKIIDKEKILKHKMLEQVATENTRNPSLSPTLLWNSLQLFLITLWVLFVAIYFRQIKREISTMKLVKHPNIVQLLEVSSSSFPYS